MGTGAPRAGSSLIAFFLLCSLAACGLVEVAWEEPTAVAVALATATDPLTSPPPTPPATTTENPDGTAQPQRAVAWYGQVRTLPDTAAGDDYLKLWHLAIWPKFGRAIGLVGADATLEAEIRRLRDRDVSAHFWGTVVCGVDDYGGCHLRVTRVAADDGSAGFAAEAVEDWEGVIVSLPAQPGSANRALAFARSGYVIALYGVGSDLPALRAELQRLADSNSTVKVWGQVGPRDVAQPATGALLEVTQLEEVTTP